LSLVNSKFRFSHTYVLFRRFLVLPVSQI
jgi:hypothetical protein